MERDNCFPFRCGRRLISLCLYTHAVDCKGYSDKLSMFINALTQVKCTLNDLNDYEYCSMSFAKSSVKPLSKKIKFFCVLPKYECNNGTK